MPDYLQKNQLTEIYLNPKNRAIGLYRIVFSVKTFLSLTKRMYQIQRIISGNDIMNQNVNLEEHEQLRLIDGHYTYSSNIIARCHLLAHRGYLSKTLTKSHDCIVKECPFFEKLNPRYWQALEAAQRKKKDNRLKRKLALEKERERDMLIRKTLGNSESIYVTSIHEEKKLLIVNYIYDRRIDLTPEIKVLRKKLNKTIKLQARKASEETIEQLIRKPRRELCKVTSLHKAPNVGAATVKRLSLLDIYCLADLFGRNGDDLYALDCNLSNEKVNRRYLSIYRSAVEFAHSLE